MPNHVHYRKTTLFKALEETLEEMTSQGLLTTEVADIIVAEFDRSINAALNKHVGRSIEFKADLDVYRFCDDLWTLMLKNISISESNKGQHNTIASTLNNAMINEMKIIALPTSNAVKKKSK